MQRPSLGDLGEGDSDGHQWCTNQLTVPWQELFHTAPCHRGNKAAILILSNPTAPAGTKKNQSWRAFDNAKDTTGSPKVSTQRMPGVSSHRPVWVNPVCAANVSSAYPPVRDAF